MADFVDDYIGVVLEASEIPGDSNLEAASKAFFVQAVIGLGITQRLQALADAGNTKVREITRALTELAKKFNKAFPNLDDAQRAEIEAVVAGLVTDESEVDAEEYFGVTLKLVQLGQKFAAEAGVLLETDPPVGD